MQSDENNMVSFINETVVLRMIYIKACGGTGSSVKRSENWSRGDSNSFHRSRKAYNNNNKWLVVCVYVKQYCSSGFSICCGRYSAQHHRIFYLTAYFERLHSVLSSAVKSYSFRMRSLWFTVSYAADRSTNSAPVIMPL